MPLPTLVAAEIRPLDLARRGLRQEKDAGANEREVDVEGGLQTAPCHESAHGGADPTPLDLTAVSPFGRPRLSILE